MTGRTLTVFAFTTVATCVLAANPAPVRAPHAMVASGHQLASQAGAEVMRQGGNAIDAAVATGFALAVVLPEAGNLGGGGFMLLRLSDGRAHFLDFRENAPAAATRNMYLDAKANMLPDASVVGYRAIAVPGSVAESPESTDFATATPTAMKPFVRPTGFMSSTKTGKKSTTTSPLILTSFVTPSQPFQMLKKLRCTRRFRRSRIATTRKHALRLNMWFALSISSKARFG